MILPVRKDSELLAEITSSAPVPGRCSYGGSVKAAS